MSDRHPLRGRLAAFVLAGALLLLATVPPCAPVVCPMDAATLASACHPLEGDCCQTQGEQAAQPAPSLPLPQSSSPADAAAVAALLDAVPVLPHAWEEVAAPAIVQGLGLHAFLAVFLI